jgi:hypothetical protein
MKETLLIALTLIAVLYFNLTGVVAVNFITLNIGVGLIAYLFAVFFTNIFKKYIPEEEEPVSDEAYTASEDGDPDFEGAVDAIQKRNEENRRLERELAENERGDSKND